MFHCISNNTLLLSIIFPYPHTHLDPTYVRVYLFFCLLVYVFIYLFTNLFIHLFIYLLVYLFIDMDAYIHSDLFGLGPCGVSPCDDQRPSPVKGV